MQSESITGTEPPVPRVLLVTGASRGLGAYCAQRYIDAGHAVACTGRSQTQLDRLFGGDVSQSRGFREVVDLGNDMSVKRFAGHVVDALGVPDVVIHAAGGGLGLKNPLLPMADFEQLLAANLTGAMTLNQYIVPSMIERGSGSVIHVGSTAATHAVGSVGYNTVKAALSAYVRSLGRELAGSGVVICGINPGAFFTEDNAMGRLAQRNPAAFSEFTGTRLPRGYMASVSEVFALIDFLGSPQASMMSGSMVAIDAGESLAYDL